MRIALILLLMLCSWASAETFTFDNTQSDIRFKIGHFGGTAGGEFKEFQGRLEFDEERPENSKVELTIQVKSLDTDSAKRDKHLLEEEYFHSSEFPTITFKSKAFKKRGKRQYVVTGPLTIRGVEKNITLQVDLRNRQAQWAVDGEALLFKSEYELNRMDFGVSAGRPAVGKMVDIKLNIKAFEE